MQLAILGIFISHVTVLCIVLSTRHDPQLVLCYSYWQGRWTDHPSSGWDELQDSDCSRQRRYARPLHHAHWHTPVHLVSVGWACDVQVKLWNIAWKVLCYVAVSVLRLWWLIGFAVLWLNSWRNYFQGIWFIIEGWLKKREFVNTSFKPFYRMKKSKLK